LKILIFLNSDSAFEVTDTIAALGLYKRA